eukprot:jgi/Mesvir1/22889/Mv19412-RA.1
MHLYKHATSQLTLSCQVALKMVVVGSIMLALLRQEVSFFDPLDGKGSRVGDLVTRVIGDMAIYQEAIGDKMANTLYHSSTFVAGTAIGLYYGWEMTLTVLAAILALGACGIPLGKKFTQATLAAQRAFADAGAIAQEAISGIRTVASFTGEERTERAFGHKLVAARSAMVTHSFYSGMSSAFIWLVILGMHAFAFWFGGLMISQGRMEPAAAVKVFVSIMLSA